MLLKKTKHVLAVATLLLGFGSFGCTDDAKPEEPVQPTAQAEAAKAPEPAAPAEVFAPKTVFFAFDDYSLNGDAQSNLQGLADHLKKTQNAVVQIEGHCDERGSVEYNLALGERRAQSVKNYLVQLGVEGGRLSTISYGEEKPSSDGHDEAAWAKNRRAEFTLTNQ
jgi:peptidoglycan-associated lipoprotein